MADIKRLIEEKSLIYLFHKKNRLKNDKKDRGNHVDNRDNTLSPTAMRVDTSSTMLKVKI